MESPFQRQTDCHMRVWQDRAWRGHTLSSFGRRALATMIDSFAIHTVLSVVARGVVEDFNRTDWSSSSWLVVNQTNDLAYAAVYTAVALVYFVPVMIRWNGRTLGKAALRIRVVREDERPMDVKTVLIRNVLLAQGVVVNLVFVVAVVDYLWPLRDRQRRALHDLAARTRVVREPAPAPAEAI